MLKRLVFIAIVSVMAVGVAIPLTFAKGLQGNRYIGVTIGQTIPGDDEIKNLDDTIFLVGGVINFPSSKHVDLGVSYSFGKMETDLSWNNIENEITSEVLLCGITYSFLPGEKSNPFFTFMAGLATTKVEGKIHIYNGSSYSNRSYSEEMEDFAIVLGGGIEISLSDRTAIRPTIQYHQAGDENDFLVGMDLNLWLTDSFFGVLSSSVLCDAVDFSYSAGIGFSF